jgi:hypothetical protein
MITILTTYFIYLRCVYRIAVRNRSCFFSWLWLVRCYFSLSPLPGGAALGFIGQRLTQNLRTKEMVFSKSTKNEHLEGNLCYLAFGKTIGRQKRGTSSEWTPG